MRFRDLTKMTYFLMMIFLFNKAVRRNQKNHVGWIPPVKVESTKPNEAAMCCYVLSQCLVESQRRRQFHPTDGLTKNKSP